MKDCLSDICTIIYKYLIGSERFLLLSTQDTLDQGCVALGAGGPGRNEETYHEPDLSHPALLSVLPFSGEDLATVARTSLPRLSSSGAVRPAAWAQPVDGIT